MPWSSVSAGISFDSSMWNIEPVTGFAGDLSPALQSDVLGLMETMYATSPYFAGILNQLTSSAVGPAHGLRIGASTTGGGHWWPGAGGKQDYIFVDPVASEHSYFINDHGALVQNDFRLTLAHEISHQFNQELDPVYTFGSPYTHTDYTGTQVYSQNEVATDLGLTEKIRASYWGGIVDSDPRFSLLSSGISYSQGHHINVALLGGYSSSDAIDTSGQTNNSSDLIFGFGGDDTIASGSGADYLYGGTGDDLLVAGTGDDMAFGEGGSDTLLGGPGADTLLGGAGDDSLMGGAGANSMSGGAGADTIYGGGGADTVDGGDGDDLVSFRDAPSAMNLTAGAGGAFSVGAGAFVSVEGVEGSTFNDTISGFANAYGGAGNDSLLGGADTGSLSGDAGNDTLLAASGDHVLSGGEGSDLIMGGSGADTLDGGGGNDRLVAGSTYSRLDGGAGDDVYDATDESVDSESGATATAVFGLGSGHDYVNVTYVPLEDYPEVLVPKSNIASIDMTSVNLSDVEIVWDKVFLGVTPYLGPDEMPMLRYEWSGDAVLRLNENDTIYLGKIVGNRITSDLPEFDSGERDSIYSNITLHFADGDHTTGWLLDDHPELLVTGSVASYLHARDGWSI